MDALLITIIDLTFGAIQTLDSLLSILAALEKLRRRRREYPARNPSRRGARLAHAGSLRSLERRSDRGYALL